jgi:hypothetical protein
MRTILPVAAKVWTGKATLNIATGIADHRNPWSKFTVFLILYDHNAPIIISVIPSLNVNIEKQHTYCHRI